VLLHRGTNPNVEHGRLVPDVVPFDHRKDINFNRVKFEVHHTCIRDTPMRETILRVDRRGLL